MMIVKSVLVGCVLALGTQRLCAQRPLTPSAPVAGTVGSKIRFQESIYDFGKVRSGELFKHSFIFTNMGDALLVLTNVQPQCGCTTAGEWSHQVEPGKTGTIAVQFNSANFSGPVLKTITVTSNDKSQPSVGLQLKGIVWKPIDVKPTLVVLTIPSGTQSNVTTPVHIVNNMEEPITLSPPESNNKMFRGELRTNIVGKDFQVVICAVPPFQPNARGQITLKTSSASTPMISFTVWANVQ
jgi:hypothetical protein